MKRLLLALVVVAACGVGLAFYMCWIGFASDSASGTYSITFLVNCDKFHADAQKAVEKLHGSGQAAKE